MASKYGKPIIDRVLTIDTPLEQAMCCALISIDSTLRSNLSVGLPLDTLLYRSGSFSSAGQHRITDSDPYFNRIRKAWSEGRAVAHLPDSADLGASGAGRGVVARTLRRYRLARRRYGAGVLKYPRPGGKVSVVLRPTTASFSNSGKN